MFKPKIYLLLLLMFIATSSFAQSQKKSEAVLDAEYQGVTLGGKVVGRYQLFQVKYQVYFRGSAAPIDQQGVMKLDTATGKTWVYMETYDKEKSEHLKVWGPIGVGAGIEN